MKKPDESGMMTGKKEACRKLQKKKTSGKSAASENAISHAIGIVKQPLYLKTFVISALAFGILYSFLYGLWRIPAIDFGINRMSAIGITDYAYLFMVTAAAGLMFALFRYERVQNTRSGSKAGLGGAALAGIVSTVCPACQGIAIIALGSTAASLPLAFLVPYIGLIQMMTVLILGFALYLKANSVYTRTCITCKIDAKKALSSTIDRTFGTMINAAPHENSKKPTDSDDHNKAATTDHKKKSSGKGPFLYRNNAAFGALMILVLMLVINNFLITGAYATAGISGGGSISIKPGFEYGPRVTLKPMPLASGESPRFQGYRTIVKPLPTISELQIASSTGDVVQDLVNNVVPRGTPWYGQEAGVSFDDPIAAQNLWAKGRAIQLDSQDQSRWERIVNSFTCDYCCGSPQSPTIITRCGCAHSQAAQGMAKWFIKNYGSQYSDEEIYGEMARWYALWYPGPTVKRIAEELQAAN
ncbi:MAG: hypothetical protein HY438_03935 [DPANN group archaeon]|nr:hypothetical protein [DPANN group archaeon]